MASTDRDAHMQDADAIEEEQRQYGHGPLTEAELDKLYSRPKSSISSTPLTAQTVIPTDPITMQGLCPFTNWLRPSSSPSVTTGRGLPGSLPERSKDLTGRNTCRPMRRDKRSSSALFRAGDGTWAPTSIPRSGSSCRTKTETVRCTGSRRRPSASC